MKDAVNVDKNTLEGTAIKAVFEADDSSVQTAAERLIAASYLLGMEHARRDSDGHRLIEAADDIPPVPFAEAAEFIKSKIPLTKKEWDALEQKVRFRAFTVARLSTADYIEAAKSILSAALESGEGYADTWRKVSSAVSSDALKLRPGYWENVYRTNTQSAYTAGKLQVFSSNPPAAIRLLVIDDSRTSSICRSLFSRVSDHGMILPYEHKFWTTYGYPPYHYQCRTGIQGIYRSELSRLRILPENPSLSALKKEGFEPLQGFGGNPLDAESWWRMPLSMAIRAAEYGLFGEVEAFAKRNGLHNFALDLVNGSDVRNLQGTRYDAQKARKADPLQKEVNAARILEENGHSVYFTPVNNSGGKNPDGIIDGRTADFKILTSRKINKIEDRIKECDKQGVHTACIVVPDEPGYTRQQAAATVRQTLGLGVMHDGEWTPLKSVKAVYLLYGGTVSILKK